MSRKWCCPSLLPLLLAAIGVLLLTGPVLASPYVDCAVPGEYATVADALADPVCDVINIDPGQYPENLVIDHDVTLAGAAADQTFLDGSELDRVILITNTATVTITGGDHCKRHERGGRYAVGRRHLQLRRCPAALGERYRQQHGV